MIAAKVPLPLLLLLCVLAPESAGAYAAPRRRPTPGASAGAAETACDRRAALAGAAGAFGVVLSAPAGATDTSVKDTKADPKYQACMSQCMYDCTKPKGDEQKSRAECIPDCKGKCATSKQQLMIGTPK